MTHTNCTLNYLNNDLNNKRQNVENEFVNYKNTVLIQLNKLNSKKRKAKLIEHEIHTLIWNFNLRDLFFNYEHISCEEKCWLIQKKCDWLQQELEKIINDVYGYRYKKVIKFNKQQILNALPKMTAVEQFNFLNLELLKANKILINEIKNKASVTTKNTIKEWILFLQNLIKTLHHKNQLRILKKI